MEPTTVAIIASASALSAFAGVVIGRLSKGEGDLAKETAATIPLAHAHKDREALDALERTHGALRASLELPDQGSPIEAGPLSSQLERFELALRELRSRKFTHAAAIYDTSGMLLFGRGDERELGVLGALSGALSSFGVDPEPDALEWSSERGVFLHVERVALTGREVLLAVWTNGARVTPSALTMTRALLSGEVREQVTHAGRARLRVSEEVPRVIQDMASELPLTQMVLTRHGAVDLRLGAPVEDRQVVARAAIWRWANAFGEARTELGTFHSLHMHHGGARVSGYAVPHSGETPEHTLWLTMPGESLAPDTRIDGWLGQLRWQLNQNTEVPTHDMRPQDTRLPESGRGATP